MTIIYSLFRSKINKKEIENEYPVIIQLIQIQEKSRFQSIFPSYNIHPKYSSSPQSPKQNKKLK